MAPLMFLSLALSFAPAQDQDLAQGQQIRVLLKNGHVLEGRLLNITPEALVLYIDELGGSLTQSRENIEHISDSKTGTQLGWREVDDREKPKPAEVETTKPVDTVKPTDTVKPADTTDADVENQSATAKALQTRLIAYQEGGFKDTDALQKELAEKSTTATAYLVPLMKELDASVLPAAATALIKFKEEAELNAVRGLLSDKRTPVRKAATEVLVSLSKTPNPYLDALKDANSEIRAIALRALSAATDPAFVRHAAPLVADEETAVRRLASSYLADWGKSNDGQDRWQVAAWVTDHIRETKSPERRARALEFLGEVPCAESLETLSDQWGRVDSEEGRWERIAIAKSLGKINLEETKLFLREQLNQMRADSDVGVVQQLALAAMDLGDRLSIPLLIPFLDHENQNLKNEVNRALEGIAKIKLDGTAESWTWWWSQQPEERQP